MEPENYSETYLLSEEPNGFLLNGTEDHFSQILDWRSDAFPVLLSNTLVTEENTNVQHQEMLCDEPMTVQNIATNELLSNDVFLQIDDNNITDGNNLRIVKQADNTTYITVPFVQTENAKQTSNLIHFVDDKGVSLLLIKESPTKVEEPKKSKEVNYKDFYTEISALKCKTCGFLCETANDMKIHVWDKHPEIIKVPEKKVIIKPITKMTSILNINKNDNKKTMFLCSVCKNSYPDKEQLKNHMIKDHDLESKEKNSSQTDENKDSEDKTDGEKSVRSLSQSLIKRQQKALRRIKCSIRGCHSRFAKDELRKRHEECHVNGNRSQFSCPECKEKFSIWRICSNHLWKCHKIDLGLFTCPMCNEFKSTNAEHLLKHMAIHNDERPFLCSECGKAFKQITQLINHEVSHKKNEGNVKLPNWSSMKRCEICDRFFANSKSYRKHVLYVHEKFKPFICNICGHKTARKEMLQLHLRQHTGAKPHHCNHCDYKTGDHNSLRRHIMRHFGDVKYACPHCEYTSIQSSAYKSHLSSKHPGKSGFLKCTYCNYSTINQTCFSSHLKCHEVELAKSQHGEESIAVATTSGITPNNVVKIVSTDENKTLDIEDDETQNCFLNMENTDDTIDTGGITIPAGLELQLEVS